MNPPRWWLPLLFLLAAVQSKDCPNGIDQRKEWRTLSQNEKLQHVQAIARYINMPNSDFAKFGKLHSDLGSRGIHGTGHFLPWHRKFCLDFQENVRKNGKFPKYVQHYWDATPRSQEAFRSSPIFDPVYGFGPLSSSCVKFDQVNSFNDFRTRCVRRGSSGFASFDDSSAVNRQINLSRDFATISNTIEGGYHGQVHVSVGGQMGTYDSPADPIFFFHHAMIDRFWALWQSWNFNDRLYQFNYPNGDPDLERLESKLLGYEDTTVNDVMDISESCYYYDDVRMKDPPVSSGPPEVPPSSGPPPSGPPSTPPPSRPPPSGPPPSSPPSTPPPSGPPSTPPPSGPPSTPPPSRPPPSGPPSGPPPSGPPSTPPPSGPPPSGPPSTPPPSGPSPPDTSKYLVIPGLPENSALDTSKMDPELVKRLRASSAGTIKNNPSLWTRFLVRIPPPPPHPSWCLIIPGLPKGKCVDKRTMDSEELDWWLSSSLDYVEKYWTVIIESVVSIPTSLRRRDTTPPPTGAAPSTGPAPAPAPPASSPASESNAPTAKSGGPIDLGEICMLKYSKPLPDSWITMNKLNSTFVRAQEKAGRELVDKLNALNGMVPNAAPANNPEIIRLLLQDAGAKPGSMISFLSKGINLQLPFEKDANITAIRLCGLAQRAGRKGYAPPTPKELAELIGVPLFCPTSVSNPFHQCSNQKYGY